MKDNDNLQENKVHGQKRKNQGERPQENKKRLKTQKNLLKSLEPKQVKLAWHNHL